MKFELRICYEDPLLIAVEKPCGLPAQGTRDPKQEHVYGMLCARYLYVGLHHRLDTPASGLMLLTLHLFVNKAIADAFREHRIQRSYRVVVLGDPGEAGEWAQSLDGTRALTRFRRLSCAGGMSLLEVELETGRTHQIRKHAVQAGHPVIGDRRHGGSAGRLWEWLALHATSLALIHPKSGESVVIESPLPPDLEGLVR